jgi:GntR family transcriptional regulator
MTLVTNDLTKNANISNAASGGSFQRLQGILEEIIANTPPGDKLLSEPALARELGVSRATLREAMRTFEGRGVIRRRQGVGTFVVSNTQIMNSGLEVLESIESLAKKIELDVSMGTLNVRQVTADEEQAEALQVDAGTPLIWIARVIHAKERPVAYLVDVLPEDVLSSTELEKGFTGSVLDFLLHKGAPPLANSMTDVCAVAAPSPIAKALEIQRGDVLLSLKARLCTTMGRVVDYSVSYFLPGYFRFHVVRHVGPGI